MSIQDKISGFSVKLDKIKKSSKAENDKMSARQRITALVDEGSFMELNTFEVRNYIGENDTHYETENEAVITGYASVGSRLCYVYSQDRSVYGGSMSGVHAAKICRLYDLAVKNGAPIIGIIDSIGGRIGEGLDTLAAYAEIFEKSNNASGVIPQISIIMGTCVGAQIFIPTISDITIITKDSECSLNPAAAADPDGKYKIGSAENAGSNGFASVIADDETSAIAAAKSALSFLPNNNIEASFYNESNDDLNRVCENIQNYLNDENYDMRNIIKQIVDNGNMLEINEKCGGSMITAFASIGNMSVGIVASNPSVKEGRISCGGALKSAKFIRLCDAFNIPVVTLVDTNGFGSCGECEADGMFLHGAKLIHAYAEATTAKITVMIGKAFGSAYMALGSKKLGADLVYAWPTATISAINPRTAGVFLESDKITDKNNPEAQREKIAKEYMEKQDVYEAAKKGLVDNIINPENTRQYLISAIDMLSGKRENKLAKKHSVMPL